MALDRLHKLIHIIFILLLTLYNGFNVTTPFPTWGLGPGNETRQVFYTKIRSGALRPVHTSRYNLLHPPAQHLALTFVVCLCGLKVSYYAD